MSDLSDFKNKNTKFTGTIGERISVGSTAERDTATYGSGTIRFNNSTNLLEYYTGTEWKSIDAPPTITNFNIDGAGATTSTFIDRTLSGNSSIVITGSLYNSGAVVSFRGNGGANFDATTTTVNNASQVTAVVPYSSFLAAQEPYSIRVTNVSGLFAQLDGCLAVDAKPIFATASGSLGTISDAGRSSYTLSSAAATDPDGDTITYSISSGALPSGLSLNSSTGAITGTATEVVSNTTSTFTVSAATSSQTATRSFSITVNAPVITVFNSPGTFTVPSGLTAVDVLVVAGGGGASSQHAGGGGGGGLIFRPGFTVTPGGSIPVTIGGGGGGVLHGTQPPGAGDSVFSTLTAKGGGGGGRGWNNSSAGHPGGSGGGGSGPGHPGAGATQPGQPGDSGTFGFGSPGGNTSGGGGAGGGGAGASGNNNGNAGGPGGSGRSYTISGSSITYAGGGGGGGHQNPPGGSGGPGGGGNGGTHPGTNGQPGTTNRGGGGGGGASDSFQGGSGGPGVVIVRY